jgi:hypothetical protein
MYPRIRLRMLPALQRMRTHSLPAASASDLPGASERVRHCSECGQSQTCALRVVRVGVCALRVGVGIRLRSRRVAVPDLGIRLVRHTFS